MIVYEDGCLLAGVDPKEVERIAKGIEKYAKQAQKLKITVFGGSSGTLRFDDNPTEAENRSIILAEMQGKWDGGCGAGWEDDDRILRGE